MVMNLPFGVPVFDVTVEGFARMQIFEIDVFVFFVCLNDIQAVFGDGNTVSVTVFGRQLPFGIEFRFVDEPFVFGG